MRKFKTWRNPYNNGVIPCRLKEIELNEGLTVLVGCNGAGKSTLLYNIKEELERTKTPFIFYDNLTEGGSDSVGKAYYEGKIDLMATLLNSSEGERIAVQVADLASNIASFLIEGVLDTKESRLSKAFCEIFGEDTESNKVTSTERWFLFDATDSGLSIDHVIDLKLLFDGIMKASDSLGVNTYIVIAANEYELACDTDCFDVYNCKYLRFKSYDDYKKFILESRKKKLKRDEKAYKWRERHKNDDGRVSSWHKRRCS